MVELRSPESSLNLTPIDVRRALVGGVVSVLSRLTENLFGERWILGLFN